MVSAAAGSSSGAGWDAARAQKVEQYEDLLNEKLRAELQAMLRREFPTPASSKATPAHWLRTILALAGTLACWGGWLQGSALACLLLPLVHWVLIAHVRAPQPSFSLAFAALI